MKVKLTRPDGTVVDIEGNADEVLKMVLALSPAPHHDAPAPVVVPYQPVTIPGTGIRPYPYEPYFPYEPWYTITCGGEVVSHTWSLPLQKG